MTTNGNYLMPNEKQPVPIQYFIFAYREVQYSVPVVNITEIVEVSEWLPFPHDFLGRTANRIINEVRGINRVVYDVTSKPPGTIEWE